MNYFRGCDNVASIKARFRELMLEHHPDRHPETKRDAQTRIAQEIIEQYHKLLAAADGQKSTDRRGKEHTYHYRQEHEQDIVDKINEVLAADLTGTTLDLIGKWLWVRGDTKPHRKALKQLSFIWHRKRQCWYWKPYKGKSFGSSGSLDEIANKYGATRFERQEEEKETKRRRLATT